MKFSDNLRKLRKEKNFSQEDLADKLGVSRQSVSKWESGVVYPEMDKMVQLCTLFNVSMDDLLNNDVTEVNNSKQSWNSINRFIDSFFKYVHKTVNMFSSMTFKERFKCLFEQFFIMFCLCIAFFLIGLIGSFFVTNLFSFLSYNVYNVVFNVFESLYIISFLVFSCILIVYIFKIRYLDYYVVLEDDGKFVNSIDESLNNDRNEKIIIRDPKHSEYKFINYIARFFVMCVKLFVFMFGVMFCFSFVGFVLCLVLSFMIVKSGLFFVGVFIVFISLIVMNYVVLNFIYDFVFSHKSKKGVLAILFVCGLFALGCGIGLSFISIRNFEFVSSDSIYSGIRTEYVDMDSSIAFTGYNIVFKESDDENIKITYRNTNSCKVIKSVDNNVYSFHYDYDYEFRILNDFIKGINDKKIYEDYDCMVEISSNKANISKLEERSRGFNHHYDY